MAKRAKKAAGKVVIETDQPIHLYFGLSYCSYLCMPRTLLQSMPVEWQRKFVGMLEEYEAAFEHVEQPDCYSVRAVGPNPIPHYQRGRTRVEPNLEAMEAASKR